jgi:hypothetical protein
MAKAKFKVGDKVIYINDAGINWGEKTITEVCQNPVRGTTYFIEPTWTPWYDHNESDFFFPDDPMVEERTVCYGDPQPSRTLEECSWITRNDGNAE